ncbi:phytanoyl-CoA dioxygenase family protein [Piscinibacter sakaiensis]|uniref:phytanoyl-CoA dioxygenase family protein n=1 Tax=Piscinibacter sakaiensis TaxID=1547922 RepID=UPI003AAB4AFB
MPALRNLLLAPWWVLQIFSSAKSFLDNPLLGSPRLNRLGLHRWRLRLAHAMTWRRRRRLARLVGAADRQAFERDGFVVVHGLLPAATFATLRSRLLAQPAATREMVQGDTITRRIAVDSALLRQVPELQALIGHPRWAGLTRYVAGYARAPWLYLQTILNQVVAGQPDPQTRLHADTFHPTMKAWFFLTDVAADEGAFCYVPGSHRLSAERLAWEERLSLQARDHADRLTARGSFRIDESELPALGLPPPRRFAVPANTLVVADTFGFHARGPSERPSVRIELWAYDRRNPYFPATTDGLLAMAGQTQQRAPLYWRMLDRLERWKLGRNPWRDRGIKTAGAPASPDGSA